MENRLMPQLQTSLFRRRVILIFSIFLVLPLIYLSLVRLVSQFMVPTDISSLWETSPEPSRASSPPVLAVFARLDPFTPDYPYLMAVRLADENPVEALRLNKRAISLSVLSPRYWIQHGLLETQQGNFREGFISFEKALFVDPMDVDAHVQKGLFLFFQAIPNLAPEKKGTYLAMAEESLSLAVRYDPLLVSSPTVAFALASVYSEKGQVDEAREILRKADDAAVPDPRLLVRKWALQLQLGDTQRPLMQWERLFRDGKLTPTQLASLTEEMAKYSIPDFRFFEAQIHLQEGEVEAALRKLSFCVSERPNVAEYRLGLGDVYEKLGKHENALEQYEKALVLSPANQRAKSKMIEYYKRR